MKTESLEAANPEILDGVDDLMQLSYLSEPSVLYNLQYRYSQDLIYVRINLNFFSPLFGSSMAFIVIRYCTVD